MWLSFGSLRLNRYEIVIMLEMEIGMIHFSLSVQLLFIIAAFSLIILYNRKAG